MTKLILKYMFLAKLNEFTQQAVLYETDLKIRTSAIVHDVLMGVMDYHTFLDTMGIIQQEFSFRTQSVLNLK